MDQTKLTTRSTKKNEKWVRFKNLPTEFFRMFHDPRAHGSMVRDRHAAKLVTCRAYRKFHALSCYLSGQSEEDSSPFTNFEITKATIRCMPDKKHSAEARVKLLVMRRVVKKFGRRWQPGEIVLVFDTKPAKG